MAIVGRPELVFLDEPTAGLDPQGRRAAWALIEELRSDGVTVLLTTHSMEEAERLADDVVIIDAGQVIAHGPPAELTRSGAARQVRFRARPELDLTALLAVLPRDTTAREVRPGDYLVEGTVDPQFLADLTAWCAREGVARRSLEELFFELTDRQ